MMQKTFIIFFYFLHFYHGNAFYRPITPFCHMTKYDYHYSFRLSDKNGSSDDSEIDTVNETFNKFLRLGRSKDEDGKSNIWSVEPKMEVVEEEITDLNKNILTAGLIITGFFASLPFLYALNQFIQKIDYIQ